MVENVEVGVLHAGEERRPGPHGRIIARFSLCGSSAFYDRGITFRPEFFF